ncbi:Ribosomal RNA small subunit methyltransferase H [Buchnera aphidicola (Eriosoma lanigerum)]|uniref:16S rRNA (cytosine(1402)-N(4))-methyltransferase RsmH n=1 Tax=Buchnera aphidicola TaxID=9 RepID=UPI0034645F79
MKNNNKHNPVMLNETIEYLNIQKNGIYFDATFGYGGHSLNILQHLGKMGKLYAIDKDPFSQKYSQKIYDQRFHFIYGNFSKIYYYAKKLDIIKKINGIIIDLGISSPQIDNPDRGFSFMKDGPLDMRMNTNDTLTASKWLLKTKKKNIIDVLKNYGEERYAKKIAEAIVKRNKINPILRTLDLSKLISNVISKKQYRNHHPATKSFQAIRIFINNELEEINQLLNNVLHILSPGARLLIISFHSLEDRIIKNFLNQHSYKKNISSHFNITGKTEHKKNIIQIKKINKITPTKNEINQNKRSRSAILRIAEIIS